MRLAHGGGAPGGGAPGGGARPLVLRDHAKPVYALAWAPGEPGGSLSSSAGGGGGARHVLSAGGDGAVALWDVSEPSADACVARYSSPSQLPLWDVSFAPPAARDHYFATASYDRTACVWATDRPHPLRLLVGHWSDVTRVGWHANGQYVLSGSADASCRLWDVRSGDCTRVLDGAADAITALALSPCGRAAAAGAAGGDVRLWDLASGRALGAARACHRGAVHALEFSADGAALVSGGADGAVCVLGLGELAAGAAAAGEAAAASPAAGDAASAPLHADAQPRAWKPCRTIWTRGMPIFDLCCKPDNWIIACGPFV